MKTSRLLFIVTVLLISGFVRAQSDTSKTVAVLNIYSSVNDLKPEVAGSLLRIELEKTDLYKVYDKHDILEIGSQKGMQLTECYGKNCLLEVGRSIGVDYMFSGSIEQLGKKMVVSLKMLDVQTNKYVKTSIQEFVNAPLEIQAMIEITLRDMLGLEVNHEAFTTLTFFNQPIEAPNKNITNNGPRVGVAFIGGDMGDRLSAPEDEGGWDAIPVVSQFGFQLEKEYLSAGNFHALLEGLVVISGPEQQLFNPKLVIMNGFRSSSTGLEFAFGPSFGIEKTAKSYFDTEQDKWFLENEWSNTDTSGFLQPNPYPIVSRLDSRGSVKVAAGWVIGVGKTFNSGYLNIPVNVFASFSKYGWQSGVSVGFNIRKKK
ncbi:hypothetical protein [Parvicella tangerina]|uniref:Uncharacterized protein n=1 Tax=Parvicella tangerina TaxID=2829795 RepID=A0A916NQS3_9FLAO|nr:hypothetical protein [Parvicella tangerina]CAG5079785.1 hypothetical protein CRYO30217_01065 [Parvicella tangerina]